MGISGNLESLSDHASKTVNAVTAPTIHKIPTTSIIPKACPSTVAERIVATSGSTHPSILPELVLTWKSHGDNMKTPRSFLRIQLQLSLQPS